MSLNPYQPPSYGTTRADVPENAIFYEMDSTKLTLREYWRLSNGVIEFLLAAVMRILRVNISFKLAFANTSYLQLVAPEQVSEVAKRPLREIVEHAQALGLSYQFTYVLPTVGDIEAAGVVMINEKRNIVMIIVYVRSWVNNIRQEKLRYGLISQLSNGSVLVTSGSPRDLDAPANLIIESYPKRKMEWVLQRHQQRVLETTSPAHTFGERVSLEIEIRRYEEAVFNYQIERGAYIPVDLAKLERMYAETTPPPTDSKPAVSNHGMLDVVFWVMLGLTAFMFWRDGPGANMQQQIFRVSLAAMAIVGLAVLWITRLARSNRSS